MIDDKELIKRLIEIRLERTGRFDPLPKCFSKRLVTTLHKNDIGTMRSLLNIFYNGITESRIIGVGPTMFHELINWANSQGILSIQEKKYWNLK